ncbi:MAG: sugar ABC transporter permease [Clostridiales bacterium]|jgi:multiple sugar transport system permease protein|nr:sugar ABC transporter permease [Clostridiales bacterium]
MRAAKRIKGEGVLILLLLPSAAGLFMFYIAPFVISIYNAVIDNPVTKNFVGLKNFTDVLGSEAFRMAAGNTLTFMIICVPLNMVLPLVLAMLLTRAKTSRGFLWLIFLLPLVIPSGSMVFFWMKTFGLNGWINAVFFPQAPADWANTSAARLIIVFIFLWKNAGYNMVLFLAGLNMIPAEYYECAAIEGAGAWRQFRMITIVYLAPTLFLTFIMSFINSFKAFKEIYMLFGGYPHKSIYMLQHFMYNQFSAANYQKLAASSYIVTPAFVAIVFALFVLQRKISENF